MMRVTWISWMISVLVLFGCASEVAVMECPAGQRLSVDGSTCVPDESTTALCVPNDCDDGNACTTDACVDDTCSHAAVEDGTACNLEGVDGLCQLGECEVVDCTVVDCRPVYSCDEEGLRSALQAGGEAVIGCDEPTTVTLTGGTLAIEKDLILDGLGNLTVDGDDQVRVFEVLPPAIVELIGIGITGGVTIPGENGAGVRVRNDSELTVRDCKIFGNSSSNHAGGLANGNTARTTIIDSELSGNLAAERGGAASNSGELTIIDSVVSHNLGLEDGGGIYNTNAGVVTLVGTTLRENEAKDNGGAIWTSGLLVDIRDSALVENTANGAGAIRLWTSAEVRVTDSVIAGNEVAVGGGAMSLYEGRAWLERTMVTDNVALGGNGGAIDMEGSVLDAVDTVFSGNVAEGGGAIYTRRSTVRLVRSTMFSNQASIVAGAIRAYGPSPTEYDVTLVNSTLSGNSAVQKGGAIGSRTSAKVLLLHSTVYDNVAPLDSGLLAESASTFEVGHSAIHDGCSGSEDAVFTSLGYNAVLDLEVGECFFGDETDQVLSSEEMNLGVLTMFTGHTPTHTPAPGSLLVDAVPPAACLVDLVDDQRGEKRGGDANACVIGAVEVQAQQ